MPALKLIMSIAFLFACTLVNGQKAINWTSKQLMEPLRLAQAIEAKQNAPVIVCIGPGATIPGSVNVGMVNEQEGVEKLKNQLSGFALDEEIVIYCGCCPFEHCPNVRPAIDVLKQMKFTNFYLLNLPKNIKTDWIDKGYPVVQ